MRGYTSGNGHPRAGGTDDCALAKHLCKLIGGTRGRQNPAAHGLE